MAGNKHSQKKGKGRSAKRANTDGFFSLSTQNKLNPLLAPYGNDH